ncbi:MAG: orotate phosphoribosyltransferase [Gemmatimonadota bacterium]
MRGDPPATEDAPGEPSTGEPAPPDPRERLLELLTKRSFRTGEFTLSSGATSDYYIDYRTTTMHAEGQALLGEVGWAVLRDLDLDPDAIGGMTMGADPIAYAVAGESWRRGDPVNAFSVRKQEKGHGTGRRIEGCFEPGSRVVLVEDVVTTGGSALDAARAVEGAGGQILAVLALVDRLEGGREALEEAGHRVVALYTTEDLRRTHAGGGA